MAERKAFPLRIRADVFDAVRRWADDDLRSVNGQIEFLLREALMRSGRLSAQASSDVEGADRSEVPPDAESSGLP